MKRQRLLRASLLIVAILIVTTLFTFGCTGTPPTTKTLKIGCVSWLGYAPGIDLPRTIAAEVAAINNNGGLTVGNDTYTIQIISYDTQATQSVEAAAVNRLVFQDGVDFILCDPWFAQSWLDTTEDNNVLVLFHNPFNDMHNSTYQLAFGPTFINTQTAVTVGWFTGNHSEYTDYVLTSEDSPTGHMVADLVTHFFDAFGSFNLTTLFYPPGSTDLSALGTQIAEMNPDVYMDQSATGLGYKAARDAGYTGQLFSLVTRTISDLMSVLSAEDLEGFIGGASPSEFTPMPVQEASDFKADYILKYGSWDNPYCDGVQMFDCLLTAIEQAGSLDVGQIADVIGNGLQWTSPLGLAKMVARADMGNSRTTDAIGTTYIKQVVGGWTVLLNTIGVDEAESYYDLVYGP